MAFRLFGRKPDAVLERAAAPAVAERRDPRGATITRQPVGVAQIAEWDADAAYRWGYISSAYVYRCIQVRAQAIAGCPFRAGLDPDRPGDWNPNAPLARLLGPTPGGPNPEMSARRLWSWTVAQRLITGRWAWELETRTPTSKDIVGLWPLVSRLLFPVPSAGGSRYFDGFVYKAAGVADTKFGPEQVLYDWIPSQQDVRQPESPLQAARYDISVANLQDRYDHAFLMNDATPKTVVVHEEFAEVDERDAWRAQFNGDHRGPDNAGKTIFAEAMPGDAELRATFHIETLGLSQVDAEFIKRHEQKVRGICVALGTPLSILGDASGRTFSNSGQEYKNWWEQTLLPDLADLQDAINMKLAPRLGKETGWFETDHVAALRVDSKIVALGSAAVALYQAGIFTKNEIRNEFDYEDVPGGEEFKQPAPAMTPPDAPVPAPAPDAPAADVVPPEPAKRAALVEFRVAKHDGAMVCVRIPAEIGQHLAIDGGEPVDQLHCTLAYLGKAAEVDRQAVRDALKAFAWPDAPLTGTVGGGHGRFKGEEADAVWTHMDVPGLGAMRSALVDHLGRAGIDVADDHDFTAHVTLAYVDPDAPMPDLPDVAHDVTVRALHVAHGGAWSQHSLMRVTPTRSAPAVPPSREVKAYEDRAVKHTAAQAARWATVDATTRILEERWIGPVSKVLDRHVAEAVKTLRKTARRTARVVRDADQATPAWDVAAATGIVASIFDRPAFEADLVKTVIPLYEAVVRQVERHMPAKRDAPVEQRKAPTADDGEGVLEAAQRFVRARANRLAGHVAQTTYEQLQSVLAEGIGLGESIPKLAARIQSVMGAEANRKRATLIARTETISAFNGGTRELALQDDTADGFEWIATNDARTRPSHAAANGQQIDTGGMFDVGGVMMQYPGDVDAPIEEIANCRCAIGVLNEFTSDRSVPAAALERLMVDVSMRRMDGVEALEALELMETAS